LRPIRPKPLMPTRTAMVLDPFPSEETGGQATERP
jgi:hypothetical protein